MGFDHGDIRQVFHLAAQGFQPRHVRHFDIDQHIGLATDAMTQLYFRQQPQLFGILLATRHLVKKLEIGADRRLLRAAQPGVIAADDLLLFQPFQALGHGERERLTSRANWLMLMRPSSCSRAMIF